MNIQTITQIIEKKNIKWIQLHFTDITGNLRVLHIPSHRFLDDKIWKNGMGFDGSSIGLSPVDRSDMIALPDITSFLILPHEEEEARIVCDIYNPSLRKYEGDPRTILKKSIALAKRNGFDDINISPEMEFYLLEEYKTDSYEIKEKEAYFIPPPLDNAKQYRKDLSSLLLKSGYNLKYHHHETGKYQHEVEIRPLPALASADFCM